MNRSWTRPPWCAAPASCGLWAVLERCALAAETVDQTAATTGHPHGVWSIVPPLVAIGLAIATRRIVASLAIGVFVGGLILTGGDPLTAVPLVCESHLWTALADPDHLRVFTFTLLMGGMVGVINRSGGMHGLMDLFAPWASNRRRGQLAGWFGGLLVFFDDYANSLLLGGTLRPIADRLRISREKLAYVVDSTAAPVSGLAIISTWVAGEIGYIRAGLENLPPSSTEFNGFGIFVATIPYRFYALWALLMVGLVAWLGRDFGPMLAAERRAAGGDIGDLHTGDVDHDALAPDEGGPRRWFNAAIPVLVVVGVVLWLLVETSLASLAPDEAVTFVNLIGEGDSYLALVYGSLAGLLAAVLLVRGQRILSGREVARAAEAGARLMAPALAILWLSWALSGLTGAEHLQTASYLTDLLRGEFSWGESVYHYSVPVAWLPTLVFVLAAAVSFSTGTSWGTMGILTPVVVETTYHLLAADGVVVTADNSIFLGTVGGVLAGAIFGDHCSPISDTTILSSRASSCDHIAHVWTQMPYALAVGVVAILFGTLPVGYGAPVWLLFFLGPLALVGILLLFGRRVE